MKLFAPQFFTAFEKRQIAACLLYGPHKGLIQGLVEEVAQHMPCRFLDEESFLSSPSLFLQPDLFSYMESEKKGTEVLIIEGVDEKKEKKYKEIITNLPSEKLLVLSCFSSGLTIRSPLVQFFMEHPSHGVVACYECSFADSQKIWYRCCQHVDLRLDADVQKLCVERTQNGGWVNAARTLSVYGLSSPSSGITVQEASALLPAHESATQWPPFCTHPIEAVIYALEKTPREDTEGILKNIRGWQRQAIQLIQFFSLMKEKNLSPEEALSQVTPTIFFKHHALFLQRWTDFSLQDLQTILQECSACEVRLKKGASWWIVRQHLVRMLCSLWETKTFPPTPKQKIF